MLIIAFSAVGRRRRPILLVVLLLVTVLSVIRESSDRDVWFPAFAVSMGAILVLLSLFLVAALRYHPAALAARPRVPAFAAGPNPASVFIASVLLLQAGFSLADSIHDIVDGEELWIFGAVPAVLWVFLLVLVWRMAWGWFGVQLRPDGVHDRQLVGSLFVPWEAFVTAYPAVSDGAQRVALYYERPELVRRRGLRVGGLHLPAASIDAGFLAWAIGVYVTHPEYRPAIGTEAELRRLTAPAGAVAGPGKADDHGREVG